MATGERQVRRDNPLRIEINLPGTHRRIMACAFTGIEEQAGHE
jgi:hypothetical protein